MELADIVTSRDFQRELNRAATMSYKKEQESGFLVYTDADLSGFYVNKAVLGYMAEDPLLGKFPATSSEMVIGTHRKKQVGYYMPPEGYRLIHIHFHPPDSCLHPSHQDIGDYLRSREANTSLREWSNEFQREVYEDDEKLRQKGYEIDYVNPVSMIAIAKDNPKDIELLVYQGITEEPITFDDFCDFVSDYCQEQYGVYYDTITIGVAGFPTRFRSTKRVVEFLNESEYLQALDIKIRDKKLSKKDLEKLRKFELIQTKFFEERISYLADIQT